jgi:Domain of unknown function (DUF4263)
MPTQTDRLRDALNWNTSLRYRRGAATRLRGIDLFYDLRWRDYFPDRRAQFTNGQCLADQVIADCPADKRPALLLTDRDEIDEGARETDDAYVFVVNLPRYLKVAEGNAAAAYLAQRLGRGITRAKSFSQIAEDEIAELLDNRLDATLITQWAKDHESRLELLRAIGSGEETERSNQVPATDGVSRAVAAIEALKELDPSVTEAIATLVLAQEDLSARAELLWALTADTDGRYTAGETLKDRAAQRIEDARSAADELEDLLRTAGETELQRFLEKNPWLLGLDYAQVRPRQPIPRGAVDFLLERFDGFHDLLELKSPSDHIFESNRRDDPIRSPSAYRLSRPLALALAQVHAYRDVLRHEDVTESLYGLFHTREPRIIIVIGRASELSEQEERLLRELNRSLHRVEIVPFDVLARRARAVLDNVEHYLLAAGEEDSSS